MGEEFVVDLGELTLLGPSFGLGLEGTRRTCISGQACRIDGLRLEVGSVGSVLLLDSCGTPQAFPQHVQDAAEVTDLTRDARWARLTLQGGTYQLCWCSGETFNSNFSQGALVAPNGNASLVGSCSNSLAFTAPLGSLSLLGPEYSKQGFTCVFGQSCAVFGISGTGLKLEDRFLILDTCGLTGFVLGASATLHSLPEYNVTLMNQSDEAGAGPLGVAWRDPMMVPSAGIYELCWCSGHSSCSLPEDFQVSAGTVTLRGPRSPQDRTCVSGQRCSVGIAGIGFQSDERFLILDTCGSSFLPWGVSSALKMENASGNLTDIGESITVSSAPEPLSAAGGVYRLCWCAAGFDCESSLSFRADVGALYLLGPRTHSGGWLRGFCHGQKEHSHQTISKAQCFNLGRQSYGDPSVVALRFDDSTSSCRFLSYCWNFVSSDASTYEIFFLQSISQDRTCVSGQTCSVDIEGLGLTAADSFLVLDSCGQSWLNGMPRSSVLALGLGATGSPSIAPRQGRRAAVLLWRSHASGSSVGRFGVEIRSHLPNSSSCMVL